MERIAAEAVVDVIDEREERLSTDDPKRERGERKLQPRLNEAATQVGEPHDEHPNKHEAGELVNQPHNHRHNEVEAVLHLPPDVGGSEHDRQCERARHPPCSTTRRIAWRQTARTAMASASTHSS